MELLRIPDMFDGNVEIGNVIKSSNPFATGGSFPFELLPLSTEFRWICPGDVRTFNENSAYSTSFSPDIVSCTSSNSLSSSELSWSLQKAKLCNSSFYSMNKKKKIRSK